MHYSDECKSGAEKTSFAAMSRSLSRIVSIVQRDEGDRWPEAELIYYKCRAAQTRTEGIIILCRSLYIHMV
jgi:hypothetical protein